MKVNLKQTKGITLIALVITIIVLLILAGVSIATLTGDNGILTQAKNAKEAQTIGNEKEILEIAAQSATAKGITEKFEINEWFQEFIKELVQTVGEEKFEMEVYEEWAAIKFKDTGNIYGINYDYDTNTYLGILTETEMEEKDYGKYTKDITDEAEKQELNDNYLSKGIQIKVTSGKNATLTIEGIGDLIIDWGDGTYSRLNELATGSNVKIASSKNNFKIALLNIYPYDHKYSEKEKEYTVRIYTDTEIYIDNNEQILEVTDWGETNIERIELQGCKKLGKIATPRDNSFLSLRYISFQGCTSLKSIPEGFFDNCPNLSNFYCTFAGCTRLTGKVPELWTRGTNSAENDYKGNPNGEACFYQCEGVSNYDEIPEFWKKDIRPTQ